MLLNFKSAPRSKVGTQLDIITKKPAIGVQIDFSLISINTLLVLNFLPLSILIHTLMLHHLLPTSSKPRL